MSKHKIKEPHSLLVDYQTYNKVVERRPGRNFARVIEKLWVSGEDYGCDCAFEILPDGNFDLVFILDESKCKLLFAGPYTRRAIVPVCVSKEYFGIRFRPGEMPRLADIKPIELVDRMIDLPKIFGVDIDILGEHLVALKDIDSKQEFMEDIFTKYGQGFFERKELCGRSAEIVELCKGKIKVQDLARLVGTSTRTLERHFLDHAGLLPKELVRLVRFQNAIEKLKNRTFARLADVAYECGYADQSHLIKEFKQLTGKPPGSVR